MMDVLYGAPMSFTLGDLLALPAVQNARPEIAGSRENVDGRAVRWVHTSEIHDIAPLLKGGEALLTTGLGLVALPAEAHRAYVAALARVGVAALLLELGRSFPTAPPALLDEAARVGLPVILLHGVVPFIEVTEQAHAAILDQEVTALREVAEQRTRLLQAMAESPGVVGLVGACSRLAAQPASLVTADGELVAGSSVPESGEREGVDVVVGGRVWGRLALHGPTGR